MGSISRIFARGLVALIPIVITIYLVIVVIRSIERLIKEILSYIIPESIYIPGLGLILSFVLIYAFGLLLNYYIIRKLLNFFENQFLRIPLIKAIYSPLRDIVQLFSKQNQKFGHPVLVEIEPMGFKAFGLVTREDFKDLSLDINLDKYVTVYIPLSYQLGGYTFIVPKNKLIPLNIALEKAMSLAITGWIKNNSHQSSLQKESL